MFYLRLIFKFCRVEKLLLGNKVSERKNIIIIVKKGQHVLTCRSSLSIRCGSSSRVGAL